MQPGNLWTGFFTSLDYDIFIKSFCRATKPDTIPDNETSLVLSLGGNRTDLYTSYDSDMEIMSYGP